MPNIPKILAGALGGQKDLGFVPMTLIKSTPGTRTPGQLLDGTNPSSTSYACKGFEENKRSGYTQYWQNAQTSNQVRQEFLTISILGATLPEGVEPKPGDRITSKGVTYMIAADGVQRDPVGAMYVCAVRSTGA